MTAIAAEILSRVVTRVFHEPPFVPCAEWADAYAYIVPDKEPVKFTTAANPYSRTILNLIHRPGVRTVVFMKSEQVGGTIITHQVLGYTIDRRPRATLIVYPNATAAGRQNTERIIPAIKATPVLRARLGPKSRDAKTLAINCDRMRITLAGAPPGQKIDANLEAHSYGLVIVDELGRCHKDVVSTVSGRGKVRAEPLYWYQGTPEFVGQDIDRLYNGAEDCPASDKGQFYVPCPHDNCRAYHVREFRHVRWPGLDRHGQWSDESRDVNAEPESVRRDAWFKCPACKGRIGAEHNLWQAERHAFLTVGQTIGRWSRDAAGEFVPGAIEGPESRNPVAGVHLPGLYTCLPASINPYGYVAEGFVAAKGKPDPAWVNRRLGHAYTAKGNGVEEAELKALCTPVAAGGYRLGTVPAWGLVLVATVDVQASGLAWVGIWAVGEGARDKGLVWFGSVLWPENTESTALDALIDRAWTRTDGQRMRAAVEVVDEGDRTDEVYARARRRRRSGRLSYTVKGVGLAGGAESLGGPHTWSWIDRLPDGSPDTRGPRRCRINSPLWKRAAHRLMRPPGSANKSDEEELVAELGEGAELPTSGRLLLPEDAPHEFLRQMVAEQLTPVKRQGSTRTTFVFKLRPGYPHNHGFDVFTYFLAVLDAMPEFRALRAATPKPKAAEPEGADEQPEPQRPAANRAAMSPLMQRARERAMRRR